MVKKNTPAGEGIGAFFSIHQVNLYDCSVKKSENRSLARA
ncbi:hypothetical protein [Klebsiella pneumoniae IS46]|nr:hypothetical protein [Klebsiella pneumoniae IS46]